MKAIKEGREILSFISQPMSSLMELDWEPVQVNSYQKAFLVGSGSKKRFLRSANE